MTRRTWSRSISSSLASLWLRQLWIWTMSTLRSSRDRWFLLFLRAMMFWLTQWRVVVKLRHTFCPFLRNLSKCATLRLQVLASWDFWYCSRRVSSLPSAMLCFKASLSTWTIFHAQRCTEDPAFVSRNVILRASLILLSEQPVDSSIMCTILKVSVLMMSKFWCLMRQIDWSKWVSKMRLKRLSANASIPSVKPLWCLLLWTKTLKN